MSKKRSASRKLDPIRVQMAEKTQRVKHDLAMKMVSERVKVDAEFAADVLKIAGDTLREDIKKDALATIKTISDSLEASKVLGKASYYTGIDANIKLDFDKDLLSKQPTVYSENDPSNPEAVKIAQEVANTLKTPENANQVLLDSEAAETCCGSCGCEDHGYVLDKQQVRDYMEKNNLSPMCDDGGCTPVEIPKEELQAALTKLSEKQTERLKASGLI